MRQMPVVVDRIEFGKDAAPPSHDNSITNWFPPIGNQDGEGSCVSWACGYYTKTFQEASEHNWDLSGCIWVGGYYGHPSSAYQDKIFSPDFIYHQVNDGSDNGSYYSDNINLLYRIGCCTWDHMPYNPNNSTTWPDEDAWRQAPWYRSLTGYNYMWVQTDPALETLKDLLADTNLAIISINANYYGSLTSEDLWTLDNYSPSATNHANTIVGYDDNCGPYTESGNPNRHGAFKVANSWGVGSWENVADGFYYISYECMKQRVQYVFFYENHLGYEPEMISVFQLDHNRRGECQTTLGIGSTSSPDATKRFDDYNYKGGAHPFPSNKIVVDVTEFIPYMSGPPEDLFLGIYDGGTVTTGTIDFFSIEIYDDYASGIPTDAYISTDPPVHTVNSATVYAQVNTGIPTMAVTSPNGGEDWQVGSIYSITWTSSGSILNISIEYSTNSGSSWSTIIPSTPNDGNHPWTIPSTPSPNCLVRISDASDGTPSDVSDALFAFSDGTPPSQVVNLVVTPTDTSAVLTWSPAWDDVGVDHYSIYRDTTSGFVASPANLLATCSDTAHPDLNVESGTTYYYRVSASDSSGNEGELSEEVPATIPTGVYTEHESQSPQSCLLMQNCPNPFNPVTVIEYALPEVSQVRLEIFDLLGQRVATLVDEMQNAGWKSVRWDARAFAAGLYFYRLEADNSVQIRKMVVMK